MIKHTRRIEKLERTLAAKNKVTQIEIVYEEREALMERLANEPGGYQTPEPGQVIQKIVIGYVDVDVDRL